MMTGDDHTANLATQEGKTNPKAEKFREFLTESKINFFGAETVGGEALTVLFRTTLNVHRQQLPLIFFTDTSIYTMIRILIIPAVMNNNNRTKVIEYLNELNSKYKIFKYSVTGDGDIVLDISLPCLPEFFDPRLVMTAIELAVNHLTEIFFEFMRRVWGEGNEPGSSAPN
ncbi:MAG: YbjN domain-containing protein [Acidaminococcales bacterium]|jgi:hypothetical protein|nr:YbjN domain-containing protein [Acidaminococcales bacterium]